MSQIFAGRVRLSGIDCNMMCICVCVYFTNILDSKYASPLAVGGWKAGWSIPTGKEWKVGNYTCDISKYTIKGLYLAKSI